MSDTKITRTRLLTRKTALWTERSSFDMHWWEIAQYQRPRGGRFTRTDVNRGTKRHGNIYDNTAIFAHRTLQAGLMSGMTSPARPWFRFSLADKDLIEFASVKAWLFQVAEMARRVFASSNTYNALHQCYGELGAFGTWANVVRPDFDNVIHHYPMTVGEYAISTNDKGKVDTLVRDFQMTVGQLVKQFGRENCSVAVQNLYDRGTFDAWVPTMHYTMPRQDYDRTKRDGKNMPFASIYFEQGREGDELLGEGGFKNFPALCPRWDIVGNDIYGHSPGMDCLGDVKQLQHEQLRKSQAIDYQVNPPLQIPTQYRDQASKRMPGGVMFVDATGPGGGVRSAYEVNLNLQHLGLDIEDTRNRIRQAYYADLFLMLANDSRSGTTATEIAERHEEKLLVLGPVLERLHDELLSPLIDITFERMMSAGILPPPPPEMAGMDLNIEFISTLAQAQRAVASAGTDRLLGTVSSIVAIWPEVRHKINAMQIVDDYADMFGVNPKIVLPDDQALAADQAEKQAAAAQQQGMAAAQAVDSAKTASEINPTQMRDVLNMFQGYNSPTATEVAA